MSTIKEKVMIYIEQSKDLSFLRPEFSPFGSYSGVGRALRQLVAEGRLVRIGYGAYIPAQDGEPTVDLDAATLEVLNKLGAEPEYGGRAWREWMEGRTTQIPVKPIITVRRLVKRKLGMEKLIYRYEYDLGKDQ